MNIPGLGGGDDAAHRESQPAPPAKDPVRAPVKRAPKKRKRAAKPRAAGEPTAKAEKLAGSGPTASGAEMPEGGRGS